MSAHAHATDLTAEVTEVSEVTAVAAFDPAAETRLLIFGLSGDVTVAEVRGLLGRCRLAPVELLAPAPAADRAGAPAQAVGLVHLPRGRLLAAQLCERISQRRLHGRRLLGYVPTMAWG
jgi:hypothetical protein